MLARSHAPRSPRAAAAPGPRPAPDLAAYGNAAMAEQLGSPEAAFDASLGGAGGGLPYLDELEGAFGEDLGDVRAHLGAASLPDQLGASAAASGDEVAFASAAPDFEQVAHEVAHVLQARKGSGAGASAPGDRSETQAQGAARAVAEGRTPGPLTGTGAAVHGDWLDDAEGWIDDTVDAVCGGDEEAVSSEAPADAGAYGGESYGGESYGGESFGGESSGGEAYGGEAYTEGEAYGGSSEAPAEEESGFMDWVDELLAEEGAPTEQADEACPEEGGFMDWMEELLAEEEVAAEQAPADSEPGFMDWLSENFGEGEGELDLKTPSEEDAKEDAKNEAKFEYKDGELESTLSRTVLKEEFKGPSFDHSFETQIAPGVVGSLGAKASVGLDLTGKVGVENAMDTTPPAPTNDGYWLQTASVFGEAGIKASATGEAWLGAGPGVANIVSVTGNLVGEIKAEAASAVTLRGTMQRYVNLDEGRADPWSGSVSAELKVPIELSAGLKGAIKYKVLMLDGTAYEMVVGKYSLATGDVTGTVSAGIPDGVVSTAGVSSLEWNKFEHFPASHLGTSYGGGGGSGAPAEGYGEEAENDGAGGGAGH